MARIKVKAFTILLKMTAVISGSAVTHFTVDEAGSSARGLSPLRLGTVFNLLVRSNGHLWICSENGLFSWDHEQLTDLTPGVELGFVAITEDPSGKVLLTTYDGQLVEWDRGNFTSILQADATFWRGLHLDRVGRLWIGTYGKGLYCYDTIRVQVFERISGKKRSPVLSMDQDRQGRLWLAAKYGVVGFDGRAFSRLPGTDSLENYEISSVLIDSQGRSWIGTMAGQLFVGEGDVHRLVHAVTDTEGVTISDLRQDAVGRIWFGFRHGTGFGFWDEEMGVRVFRSDANSEFPSKIGALEVGAAGTVWLGSGSPGEWDGLCRFDGETFHAVDGISGCSILALFEDPDGVLWVGTSDGLYRSDERTLTKFTVDDGLPCEIVTALYKAPDGVLWIGTEGGGVCCYDGAVFQVIQTPGDPARNVIHQIVEDAQGRIWFASEAGLIKYVRRKETPEAVVTEVVADHTYLLPSDVQFPTTVGRIRLSFAGRSPVDMAANLIYRYRLNGYEEAWHQTGDPYAEYPRLDPGSYELSLQTVDRDRSVSSSMRHLA